MERLSATLPAALLADVDRVVAAGAYDSRSEATRDALRALVTEFDRAAPAGDVRGSIVLVYDHAVADRVAAIGHEFDDCVVATHHVHLGPDVCLESIAVDGDGATVDRLVDRLRPLQGVRRADLAAVDADAGE